MTTAIERRNTEITTFLSAVSETPDLWQSLELRIIAVRLGDRWHSLSLRCQLDARTPDSIPRLAALPITKRVACWQDVRPASQSHHEMAELVVRDDEVGQPPRVRRVRRRQPLAASTASSGAAIRPVVGRRSGALSVWGHGTRELRE